jgi:hypothetical protein
VAVSNPHPLDQQASDAHLRRYRFRRWFKDVRSMIGLYADVLLYKVLYFIHLGGPFNRLICRLGIYKQYQPGVCGWCGGQHVDAARFYRSHPWFSPDGRAKEG